LPSITILVVVLFAIALAFQAKLFFLFRELPLLGVVAILQGLIRLYSPIFEFSFL